MPPLWLYDYWLYYIESFRLGNAPRLHRGLRRKSLLDPSSNLEPDEVYVLSLQFMVR